jgi:hypothetical protein
MPLRFIHGIAGVFLAAALYLGGAGTVMLAHPGLISIGVGTALLGGFETAGPFMFLLGAAVHALMGIGLWKLWPFARRAAFIVAAVGAFLAVPAISSAAVSGRLGPLALQGLPFIVRVVIIFHLLQPTTPEAFQKSANAK